MCVKFNGWTNQETWLTNLWFDQWEWDDLAEQADDCKDRADAIRYLEDYIRMTVEQVVEEADLSGFIADLTSSAMASIDWRDLAEHHIDDALEKIPQLREAPTTAPDGQ